MSRLSRWLRALGRPAVVAHRGASRRAPENSLAALRIAAELGADAVEFDVQACADGTLVVFHDRTLARCTGVSAQLRDTSYAQVRPLTLDRVDLAVTGQVRGERVPTLDEWLAAAPPGLFLNLEVKADELRDAWLGRACVRALQAAGRAESTVVSSFHPGALADAAIAGPSVERGALVDAGAGWQLRLGAGLATAAVSVHPHHALVTAARVRAWHALGCAVLPWTIDDPEEAQRCLDCGVDALITNVPDRMRPLVERMRRAG